MNHIKDTLARSESRNGEFGGQRAPSDSLKRLLNPRGNRRPPVARMVGVLGPQVAEKALAEANFLGLGKQAKARRQAKVNKMNAEADAVRAQSAAMTAIVAPTPSAPPAGDPALLAAAGGAPSSGGSTGLVIGLVVLVIAGVVVFVLKQRGTI
jgi:hypothetical protein